MTRNSVRLGIVLAAAVGFVAATSPVQARAANAGNAIETAPGASGQASAPGQEKRYCIVDEVTGSRIPVKVCKTKKEWEAQGVRIQEKG